MSKSQTHLQALRIKQISQLRSMVERMHEIEPGVRFEVPVPPGELRVCVYLGPGFPAEAPVVTVAPDAAHPWISVADMRVTGNRKLNDWNQHNNLGKRVKEIVSEFTARPPKLGFRSQPAALPPSTSGGMQMPRGPGQPSMLPPMQHHGAVQQQPMLPHRPVPVPPHHRGLEELSNAELERLLADDAAFRAHQARVEDLPQKRKNLREVVEQMAKANLSTEERATVLFSQLSETQAELKRLEETYQSSLLELGLEQKRFSSEAVAAKLKSAAARAEALSEDIEEQFLRGGVEPDNFVSMFVEHRTAYHLHKGRYDRVIANPASLANLP